MSVETGRWRGPVASTLSEGLTAAVAGSGRLILLLGEAGIGKTTTARDTAALARRSGVTVRWSACWSDGATVAHAPWLTLLSGLGQPGRRAIDSLLGADFADSAAAGAARASAYATVISALEEATAERPVLLVLDDLHWADLGTLQLLDAVTSHLPGMGVLIVGTYRDTDVVAASPLTRLGGGADRMTLRGLDHDGVVALLGDQLGVTRASELGVEVIRLTGGNPFLVVQVGRLLADETRTSSDDVLAPGARDLLQQRLGFLDESDRVLLAAAAVLGTPFRAIDLEPMVARTSRQVTTVLDRAAALRIVERAPGTGAWGFVHDLFRQAALDGLSSTEISDLHRRAAEVLEHGDAEPAVIAAHLLSAGAGQNESAASWSVRAGDRALAAMAWEEAAGHYERALEAGSADDEIRADAMAGLGRALLLSGDEQRAGKSFDDLARLARSCQSPELLARAALGFSADLSGFEVRLFQQHQIDLLEEAARVLEGTSLFSLRALVLARLSVALSMVAPDSRRLELAETAVAIAREADEPIALARVLAAHCDAIAGPDHVDERAREASEIIAIAEAAGDGPLELLGRRLRYVARLEQGDVQGVEEDTSAFARRSATLGNPLYAWYVPLWRAQMALIGGDVDGTEALIVEAEALGRASGSTNGPMLATVLRLAVGWQQGDHSAVVARVESLGELAPELVDYVSAIGCFAWAYTLANRPIEAAAFLDRAVALGLTNQILDAEWLPNMVNLIRSAAALDHPVLVPALELLEPYADLIAFEGIGAGLYGSVARFVAIGCAAAGRHGDAVEYAERALQANRSFGGTLVADSYQTLADCLRASGESAARADAVQARADATYRATGTAQAGSVPAESTAPDPEAEFNELRRHHDAWQVKFGDSSMIVRHSKGLTDLAVLLARPGREIHITELEGIPAAMVDGHGGDAVDRRTIAAYKDRLTELAEELDEADSAHDIGRAERARVEYDTLVEQLSSSLGIGGRIRAAGPEPIERLRKAVSARIRDAIRRLETTNPALGRHLTNAVHTGVYCSYRPESPAVWRVEQ